MASAFWLSLAACNPMVPPKVAAGIDGGSSPETTSGSDVPTSTGSGGSGGTAAGSGGSGGAGGSGGTGSGGAGGSAGASGSGGASTDSGSGDSKEAGGTGGVVTTDAGRGDLGGAGGVSGDAGGGSSCPATGLSGAGQVKVVKSGVTFFVTRDGNPYYIKGIAGGANLTLAQQYGVNSTRTFSSNGAAGILDGARSHCMTVLLGIELSKDPADYANAQYTDGKRAEVTSLLATVKTHPALLMWALGNETNLGADTQAAWAFIGQLAQLIHQQDPNHPVITVFAGANVTAINHMVQWSQGIDVVGINSYAAVVNTNTEVARSTFTGPVIVTEWGPTGHWESPNTSWGRPIEETSGAKSRVYKTRYESFAHTGRILGDYVFLWGQKIERTPTWYGMFLETNPDLGLTAQSLPTVDVMALEWSGAYPGNRAPDVTALTLGGKAATANVALAGGQSVAAEVTATEPDGDTMSYVWEILQDPAQPDLKGAPEPREARVGTPQMGTTPRLNVTAPSGSGQYRLLVYVLDGKGHAGTANIPFRVN
ncbi:MAG TPA: glycoside hydrolase family 2 TIM barrel-domain containing protein [Polyangia bacterium]|nr:glycoside hydrolase family 2 TIM barrel-domain containing protein [Polyangia bacterium]